MQPSEERQRCSDALLMEIIISEIELCHQSVDVSFFCSVLEEQCFSFIASTTKTTSLPILLMLDSHFLGCFRHSGPIVYMLLLF